MSITDLTTTELRRHLRATIRTAGEHSAETEMIRRELRRREQESEVSR